MSVLYTLIEYYIITHLLFKKFYNIVKSQKGLVLISILGSFIN